MIPRYEVKEMSALFSDVERVRTWLQVEMAALKAMCEAGKLPAELYAKVEAALPQVDAQLVSEIEEREKVTRHDVAAFVDVIQARAGVPEARFIHFGLTSADVVDTALSLTLSRALSLIIEDARKLRDVLDEEAIRHKGSVMLGRTHGMHAEPITFGSKLALFSLQLRRDLDRLYTAKEQIEVGKLSGPVGTHSNIEPEVERRALELLNLKPVPATQVVARDRHAQVLYSLASLSACIEAMALEVRHLARSEVGEVLEPFSEAQKGSSAMPHKRNPVLSERLTGLARLVRAYLIPALENVALWHERDISHSSVERMIFPDAFGITCFMLREATALFSALEVHPEKMRSSLETSPAAFTQSLLLKLVEKGMERDAAYQIVKELSMRSISSGEPFRVLCEKDERIKAVLAEQDFSEVFDLSRLLRHANWPVEEIERLRAEGL